MLLLALTYHLLKKFPVSMVAIYILPLLLAPLSNSAISVETEEVQDNIEITTKINQDVPQQEEEELEITKKPITVKIEEALPKCSYSVTAYHKLFILYERFSIDRQTTTSALKL